MKPMIALSYALQFGTKIVQGGVSPHIFVYLVVVLMFCASPPWAMKTLREFINLALR